MLTFQEHMLVSHLILPHFSNLCSHFRNICWCLISFYLLLASFQQSMLTFRVKCNLCSHFRNSCWSLISFYLGDKHFSLILAIYAHIQELMLYSVVQSNLYSVVQSNLYSVVQSMILPWRQAFQPISFTFQLDFIFAFFFFFGQIGRVSHLMSSLLHEYRPADLNKSPADLNKSPADQHRLLFRSGQAVVQNYKPYNQGWLKLAGQNPKHRLQICPSFGFSSQIS